MKKTVSINIGSIIFHIEEDGYDKLKGYLDSINKYFSSFEDSKEIISDIESRIAEIFLEKLAEGRQSVTLEDVEELIATMGTTKDFDATIEVEEDEKKENKQSKSNASDSQKEEHTFQEPSQAKRLYRDVRRQKLGGVAAGLAYYFGIDPLWVRLLFLVLFFNIFLVGLSGAALLLYIILWVVIPGNHDLEEDKKIKKLFRDGDSRVLGGVASGIAKYFGTDIAVIRVLFILSIFLFGSGILLYLILWIITPEARTITEKMQMQGEPVTLSNIEHNVKKGLNADEGEESAFIKIILFPFRLIAMIIQGLGRILGPLFKLLIEILRVLFGLLIVIIGFSVMLSILVATFALFGFTEWQSLVHADNFPIDLLARSIDDSAMISAFLVAFIPALLVTLAGLMVIAKRTIIKSYVGWSMFGIWTIALIISAFSIPRFISEFAVEDDVRKEMRFEQTSGTPTLRLNDLGPDNLGDVDLKLRGHSDSTYLLVMNIESRGSNREEARANAESITYNVIQDGDDFYFDSSVTFEDSAAFRFQNVNAFFYIPFGKQFRMEGDLDEILVNTLHLDGYRSYQMEGNDWVFERGRLKCLTCPENKMDDYDEGLSHQQHTYKGTDKITYPFENFDEIEVASYVDIDISKGDKWSVVLRGDDNDLDDVYLNQIGDRLEVKFKEDTWEWWKDQKKEKIGLFITMPELEYLNLVGDCDGEIKGFDNEDFTLNATGGCDLYMNISANNLELNLTGASNVELKGSSDQMKAEIIGASRLEAFDHNTQIADINVVGASRAEVFASEEMELNAAGASHIVYQGTSKVDINEVGLSSVKRRD